MFDEEPSRSRLAAIVATSALFAGWLAWAFLARVAVIAEGTGCLVPVAPPRLLAAPADAVLASRRMDLGARVAAGDVVATFESRDLTLRLATLDARHRALTAAAAALAAEAAAGRTALAAARRADLAADGERQGRRAEADIAARLAATVDARDARLAAAGALAPAAAERSHAEAAERAAAAGAVTLSAEAAAVRDQAARIERRGAADRVAAELAHLASELAAVAAEASEVARELARREVRAPVAGRLYDLTAAQPGAFLARGAPLAMLLPDGPLVLAAEIAAPDGALVRPGEPAWVRLPAAGSAASLILAAWVTAAAPAARPGGRWEVQVAPVEARSAAPPPRPGLPCEVAIEIGRATPAQLLLRGLGGSRR
jgi:multidrug resistance efflux pump